MKRIPVYLSEEELRILTKLMELNIPNAPEAEIKLLLKLEEQLEQFYEE